jgi:hypothetical protein
MSGIRAKRFSFVLGSGALLAAVLINAGHHGPPTVTSVAGGSGDSSTTGSYTQPVVPGMSINPTAMSLGSTVTAAPASTTLAVGLASPSVKATAAAGCVNNGQCP